MGDTPESIEYKGRIVGKVLGCTLIETIDADGKKHASATCASKEDRDKLAEFFEREMTIRVNPKVVLEESPSETPVTQS